MKKILLTGLFAFCALFAIAQAPSGFNYQAAIRNNSGNLILNQAVKVRFTIHDLTAGGTVLYQETQSLTTNTYGLVSCEVGKGTVVTGSYPSTSDWSVGAKFLQVEVDPAGGSTFTDLGTMQIMSVPYANFAEGSNTANSANYSTSAGYADSLGGTLDPSKITGAGAVAGQVLKWDGSNWIPDVDNSGGSGGSDNWGTQTVITNATLSGNGTSGNSLRIAQQGATSGQVLKWNGTTWTPAKDSSGGTYTGGTGITISGNAINSTWTTSGNDISSNNSGNVKIGGNLGLDGTSPDNTYNIKSSGSGNREMLLDATGTSNFSGIQLRGSTGTNDYLYLRKYGSTASGTYADGSAIARSASIVTGNSVSKFIIGPLASNGDMHLFTAGRTRLQIDKDGNMYTGLGYSPGAKLYVDKGSQGYLGATGSFFAPSIDARCDTSVKGYYPVGVAGYGAGNRGGIGGAFVSGRNQSDTSYNYGIYAEAAALINNNGSANYGIYSYSYGAKSNYGNWSSAYSSRASTLSVGLYGYASGESYSTTAAYGVYGFAEKASTGYAGYFAGNTHVNGTLSKSAGTFKIDHPQDPENKYLIHSFVESPDMMNVYNGNVVTDLNGDAVVDLPAYFEAENINFKYQLTVIGQFAQAIVLEEVKNNQFKIKTDKPNVKVSWQVTGVRNDEFAKQNRIVAEVNKSENEKGKYLNPELFNQPAAKGIHYIEPGQRAPFQKSVLNKQP